MSVTALLGPVFGLHAFSFLLLMLLTLSIGFWRQLGSQASQVAVAAVFGYATYAEAGVGWSSAVELLVIGGLVLLGASVGIAVNMLVFPPIRYRSAEHAVGSLGKSLGSFCTDMGCRLWYGAPDRDTAEYLRRHAEERSSQVDQATDALDNALESSRLNPRRLFHVKLKLYSTDRTVLNSLERSHHVLRSIARGLYYMAQQCDAGQECDVRFRLQFAKVLIRTAQGLRHIGQLHSVEDAGRMTLIERDIDISERRYHSLAAYAEHAELDVPGTAPVYGSLLVDLRRLVSELRAAKAEIDQVVVPTPRTADLVEQHAPA